MKKQSIRKLPRSASNAIRFPQSLSTKQEWLNLAQRLTLVLGDMDEDEYLILSEKKRTVYIQFAAQGAFGMRVEAVSEALCGPDVTLSKEDKKTLKRLGWSSPTYTKQPNSSQRPSPSQSPNGSCNYYVGTDASIPFTVAAELAVRTLSRVYHTRHPGVLQYRAYGSEGYDIRFPSLGLKRAQK